MVPDLRDERLVTLTRQGALGCVGLREVSIPNERDPNEKGQAFQYDELVAFDPVDLVRQAVQSLTEMIIEFVPTPAIEPGLKGVLQDDRLIHAGSLGERFEPVTYWAAEEELVASLEGLRGHATDP
jgi:hypothetical protein